MNIAISTTPIETLKSDYASIGYCVRPAAVLGFFDVMVGEKIVAENLYDTAGLEATLRRIVELIGQRPFPANIKAAAKAIARRR